MRAIIIMGPPGAGKGTQANLISKKLGYVHLDTGAYFEELLYDPSFKNNKEIQKERKIFEFGGLLTPSWVLKTVKEKIKNIAKAKMGIILSGSLRTIYETFGDKLNKGLLEEIDDNYGRKNIFIFELRVFPKDSIKRNSNRVICSSCGLPLMKTKKFRFKIGDECPFCGGRLKGRTLDNVKTIKNRLKEYSLRTEPIIAAMKKKNYKVVKIDGRPKPFTVNKKILSYIL